MVTAEITDVRQFLQHAANHASKGDHQDSAAECARCEATRVLVALSLDASICRRGCEGRGIVLAPAYGLGPGEPESRTQSIARDVATGDRQGTAVRAAAVPCDDIPGFRDGWNNEIALVVSCTAQKTDAVSGQGAASVDFRRLRDYGRVLSPEEIADALDDGSARRGWWLDLHSSAALHAGTTITDIEASVQKVQARA